MSPGEMRQIVTVIKECRLRPGRCPRLVRSARHGPAMQRRTLISRVGHRHLQVPVAELEMIEVLDGSLFLDVLRAS